MTIHDEGQAKVRHDEDRQTRRPERYVQENEDATKVEIRPKGASWGARVAAGLDILSAAQLPATSTKCWALRL